MSASPTVRLVRIFAFAVLASLTAAAETNETAAVDEQKVDRNDPNFVTASLLIFGPGEELFSCAGHACIRLECPVYKLDYCFTYESEPIKEKIATFLSGRLKMGMFAIPTEEFLKEYVEGGRGLRQYKMNLPPSVEQRLWKIMDDKAAAGANLPYDYNKRGCAKFACQCIMDALSITSVERMPWVMDRAPTRREKFCEMLRETHPWNIFFLNAIVGTETDNVEEVVTPKDLLVFLRKIRVDGVSIITDEGVEILAAKPVSRPSWITPMVMAWLLMAVAAVGFFVKSPVLNLFFLLLQTIAGLFFTYLVSASELPTSCWNWLIVPFNPLPLVFWRWRRWWALPFAAVLAAWEAFMLLSPHQLTDPAYLVLVMAYIVFYAKMTVGMFRPTSG